MAPESQMRDTDLICSFCRPYIYIYYCLSPLHIITIKLLKHHDLNGCPFQRFGIAVPHCIFLTVDLTQDHSESVNICSSIPDRKGAAIRLAAVLANLKDNIS